MPLLEEEHYLVRDLLFASPKDAIECARMFPGERVYNHKGDVIYESFDMPRENIDNNLVWDTTMQVPESRSSSLSSEKPREEKEEVDRDLMEYLQNVAEEESNIAEELPITVNIGGSSYTLTPTKKTDYKKVINTYVTTHLKEVTKVAIAQVKEQQEKNAKKIKSLSQHVFPKPPSLSMTMKYDIQMAVSDNMYYYIFPFTYAPELVKGERIYDPEKLRREILIFFGCTLSSQGFVLSSVELRNYDLTLFSHYHGTFKDNGQQWNCWGDVSVPFGKEISLERMVEMRDRLQNVLTNIVPLDAMNMSRGHPEGLPSLDQIKVYDRSTTW